MWVVSIVHLCSYINSGYMLPHGVLNGCYREDVNN